MTENITSAYIRCEDHAETVEFNHIKWNNDDIDCEINIVDSYCGNDFMGITGRFKRAWKAFWAKPICHSGIYIDDPERARKFFEQCIAILDES